MLASNGRPKCYEFEELDSEIDLGKAGQYAAAEHILASLRWYIALSHSAARKALLRHWECQVVIRILTCIR